MNKKFLYLFIYMLAVFFSKNTIASTDILCNVLASCNGYLKEIGEVQNKISGKTREILSKKISSDDTSDGYEIKKKNVESLKKQGTALKEKAEIIKSYAETSSEQKDELMKKYNKLNKEAAEKFDQAQKILDEAEKTKSKYFNNQADNKDDAIEDDIQDIKDDKNEAEELNSIDINADIYGKNLKSQEKMPDIVKSYGFERVSAAIEGDINQTQVDLQEDKLQISESKMNAEELSDDEKTPNRATVMSSLLEIADKTDVMDNKEFNVPSIDMLDNNKADIKPEDIIKGSLLSKDNRELKEDKLKITTKESIKDQLMGNSKTNQNSKEKLNTVKMHEINNKTVLRKKFEEADINKNAKVKEKTGGQKILDIKNSYNSGKNDKKSLNVKEKNKLMIKNNEIQKDNLIEISETIEKEMLNVK